MRWTASAPGAKQVFQVHGVDAAGAIEPDHGEKLAASLS
jgi:hypothetical protein